MRRYHLAVLLGILPLCMVFSACTNSHEASTLTPQPEIATPIPQPDLEFQPDGTASLSIPSLNGNQIAIRIIKPEGNGPFPVLIGVAGGDGQHLFSAGLGPEIQEMGIVAVDFAPQRRGASEGQDDHHGPIHQDDLKAVVDFVSPLARRDWCCSGVSASAPVVTRASRPARSCDSSSLHSRLHSCRMGSVASN